MECDKAQSMFVNDWAEALSPEEKVALEAHLAGCDSCRLQWVELNRLWTSLESIPAEEPGPASRERFSAMLEGYRHGCRELGAEPSLFARVRARLHEWMFPMSRLRPALQFGVGLALLVGGFASGYALRSERDDRGEMADLRAEIVEMRKMVTVSLLKQQSASERLKGVSWSSQVTSPDPEFLSTLIYTLNYDSSVDVRLAAVDALARFAGHPSVRQNLIKSLSRQDSPLVQITLIDLLVQLHERRSIEVLKQLAGDVGQNVEVRDRAQWGLKRLS